MPWKGVTVVEQRENFLRDYHSRYYTVSDLAERFSISRKTAYKWIERYQERGREGLADQSRRPHSCPWQTEKQICDALVELVSAIDRFVLLDHGHQCVLDQVFGKGAARESGEKDNAPSQWVETVVNPRMLSASSRHVLASSSISVFRVPSSVSSSARLPCSIESSCRTFSSSSAMVFLIISQLPSLVFRCRFPAAAAFAACF